MYALVPLFETEWIFRLTRIGPGIVLEYLNRQVGPLAALLHHT